MIMFVVLFIGITNIEAARILAVFPSPSISHQVVFRPITRELAKRGHEVTVITPDPAFSEEDLPTNLKEIDVHNISYPIWQEAFKKLSMGTSNDLPSHTRIVVKSWERVFEAQMKVNAVENLIQENQFDLLLIESCVRPTLSLTYVLKLPVIQISSFGAMFGIDDAAGAPTHPIYYPTVINQRHFNLTMWEKIREYHTFYYSHYLYKSMEQEENEMIKKLFPTYDVPPLSELYKNVDLFFLNVDPVWVNNQPVASNIVYIGGIHRVPRKALPENLQSYLDNSQHGVIYISFGSNVRHTQIPEHVVKAMIKVFAKLKYDIIWKWDRNQTDISHNVKIFEWLPQTDLLHHPKLRLFITQGGLQSTQEAILAGVPLIGIPSYGDQWYNVEKYAYHKIGIKLEMNLITEYSLRESIESVIENKSYRNNVLKLRKVLLDQPQTPLERAIWWTEYVLRHGSARHLRPNAANISWLEYFELGLVVILIACFLLLYKIACLSVGHARSIALYTWRKFSYLSQKIIKKKD